MNIGFDIDDTITNSSEIFVKYAIEYNKLKNIIYPINTNELDQTLAFGWNGGNKKEFKNLYLKKILMETTPNKNAIKVINYLKKNGNKIYLITSRNDSEISNMYEFTKKWLLINNISYDKLFVNCKSKASSCIENQIDIFIDDNFNVCDEICKKSKTHVLMYTTKYNKNINTSIVRVFNWQEILLHIIKFKKEKV